MNRSQLVAAISAQSGENKDTVNNVVETLFDVVKLRNSQGHEVVWRTFGRFYPVKKAANIGRDFKNGSIIKIPPKIVPGFKASKEFVRLFNQ
jgi:nucleoid DNA-binding protein